MDTPLAVGLVYMSAAALGIGLNSRTVWSIITQGKLKQNFSAMFILFLQPLITDIIFESIYLCFLAPSVILQADLTIKPIARNLSWAMDAIQSYCWFNNSLSQVSLAVNRFIVTAMLRPHIFTPFCAAFMSIVQHLFAISLSVALHFLLPCCRIKFSPADFGYYEVAQHGVPNYAYQYLNRPLGIACSAIPILVYCKILISARAISRRVKLQSYGRIKRRNQEMRFAAQFASIALVYILSAYSFSLLKLLAFPAGSKWIKGIPVVLALLNSMSNAVVYLLNEKKIATVVYVPSASPDLQLAMNMFKAKKKLMKTIEETRMRSSI